ncbi:MAG: DNA-directed RNA polymerase subunit A' [Patescibacteria group bacterium]|nr:MAG: DNA-directed RNA polymerase subunit A' [Patescibacteria group bacterium]
MTSQYEKLFINIPQGKIRYSIVNLPVPKRLMVAKAEKKNRIEHYDPSSGTVDSLVFGTTVDEFDCDTCKLNRLWCPGHLGYIDLSKFPVINPKLRKKLAKILNCFCVETGEPKFDTNRYNLFLHLKFLNEKYKGAKCHEGHERVIFVVTKQNRKNVIFKYVGKNTEKVSVSPMEIIKYLDRIDSRYKIKPLNRALVIKRLPVIPPCVRYYGVFNGDKKIAHPITRHYNGILQRIERLKSSRVDRESNARNDIFSLVSELFNEIENELKNKKGYIRASVMGKRVNFSGRTVLGPYNRLDFGMIMIPKLMKYVHTIPITVTTFNQNVMREFLRRRMVKTVILGDRQVLKGVTIKPDSNYTPLPGDVLEIYGRQGDEVIFNRQPTLDKQSIMGYRVQYLDDYYCFGLHSSYTTPHNADFDGDEGNLHKIQNVEARAEVRHIVSVENCLMNPKTNRPAFGLVYNCISAGYLISEAEIDKKWFISLAEKLGLLEDKRLNRWLEEKRKLTGKELFSLCLPDDFNYSNRSVVIINGVFTSGRLTSSHLAPTEHSILHRIYKTRGKKDAVRFLTLGQRILDEFLGYYGLSIGISSLVPKKLSIIKKLVENVIQKTIFNIKAIPEGSINRENKICNALNTVTRIGIQISKNVLKPENPLNVMSLSGAKGKEANTAQIIGSLGQQYIFGSRPEKTLTLKTRCLPYFEPNSPDHDIESRGFVKESFMEGADPPGFIFHMMASRVGLIDSAIKTGDIGYSHRKLVKSLENLVLEYDGTVRDNRGNIFNFSYTDGFYAGELLTVSSAQLTTLCFVYPKEF